jgi:hypothetical protein
MRLHNLVLEEICGEVLDEAECSSLAANVITREGVAESPSAVGNKSVTVGYCVSANVV